MKISAVSTGTVRITPAQMRGEGAFPVRLLRMLADTPMQDSLPIWCFVIEHPEGLILVDTGIPLDANKPIWFPPHMRLVQRAAPFQIASRDEEIDRQLAALGYSTSDVRWVILTHLHQDHEGGLHHFPQAEFLVSRAEWSAARGLKGRMAGYINQRWPAGFAPMLVDFDKPDDCFDGRHALTKAGDVYLVPTPGHTAGHLSVVAEHGDVKLFFAGDTSYTQALLLEDALDGVSINAAAAHRSHRQILTLCERYPTIYMPSHEWASKTRLEKGEVVPAAAAV